jgi:hypothetical protein
MQRDTNPSALANRAPRFSAPQPVARISGPAGAATPSGDRPGLFVAGNRAAPPVYRPQMPSLAMQPKMPIGTAKRPTAPPVFRPQQAPIVLQTKSPSTPSRIAGHVVQPFAKGVIQAKPCNTCQSPDHITKDCPRRVKPATLGSSHTTRRSTGKPVGHGRKAAEGGHNSQKRLRGIIANRENSIEKAAAAAAAAASSKEERKR